MGDYVSNDLISVFRSSESSQLYFVFLNIKRRVLFPVFLSEFMKFTPTAFLWAFFDKPPALPNVHYTLTCSVFLRSYLLRKKNMPVTVLASCYVDNNIVGYRPGDRVQEKREKPVDQICSSRESIRHDSVFYVHVLSIRTHVHFLQRNEKFRFALIRGGNLRACAFLIVSYGISTCVYIRMWYRETSTTTVLAERFQILEQVSRLVKKTLARVISRDYFTLDFFFFISLFFLVF